MGKVPWHIEQRVLSQAADRWSAPQLAHGNLVVVPGDLGGGVVAARMSLVGNPWLRLEL